MTGIAVLALWPTNPATPPYVSHIRDLEVISNFR